MLRRLSWSPLHLFVLDMASLMPCTRIAFVPEQGEPIEPASRCSLSSVNASSQVFDAVIPTSHESGPATVVYVSGIM